MTVALIDADVVAYQAAAAVERPSRWDEGLWTLHAWEEEADDKFDQMLDRILVAVKADECVLAFTDSANWRKAVLPTYKSNRAEVRKPMLLKYLRERAESMHTCYTRPTLEGDDCLGILATSTNSDPMIVCSIDKDFKTIEGYHYNFGKEEFFHISPAQADYWHLFQTLTGDTTDGYSGCPKVGAVNAARILDPYAVDPESDIREFDVAGAWVAVVKAFEKAGLSEEEALVQARVARICRKSDYDFKKKEVILWNPPVLNK